MVGWGYACLAWEGNDSVVVAVVAAVVAAAAVAVVVVTVASAVVIAHDRRLNLLSRSFSLSLSLSLSPLSLSLAENHRPFGHLDKSLKPSSRRSQNLCLRFYSTRFSSCIKHFSKDFILFKFVAKLFFSVHKTENYPSAFISHYYIFEFVEPLARLSDRRMMENSLSQP